MGPRRRCYISGPITGTDDYMERFARAAERLRGMGYEPVNPAAVTAQLPPMEWAECMAVAAKCMEMCGTIYQMRGWQGSRGAVIEWHLAAAMGMDVLDAEGLEPDAGGRG